MKIFICGLIGYAVAATFLEAACLISFGLAGGFFAAAFVIGVPSIIAMIAGIAPDDRHDCRYCDDD